MMIIKIEVKSMRKRFGNTWLRYVLIGTAAIIGILLAVKLLLLFYHPGLDPNVKMTQYKGIEVTTASAEVTPAMVEEYKNQQITAYCEATGTDASALSDTQLQEIFGTSDESIIDANLGEGLKISAEARSRQEIYDSVYASLLETCSVDPFPEDKLKSRFDEELKEAEENCSAYYGMELSDYYEMLGMTKEEYETEIKAQAKENLTKELILLQIAKKERLKVKGDEFTAYIEGIGKETYEEYGEDRAKELFLVQKALDWVVDHADVTYINEMPQTN